MFGIKQIKHLGKNPGMKVLFKTNHNFVKTCVIGMHETIYISVKLILVLYNI